jgi:hypothetical protein
MNDFDSPNEIELKHNLLRDELEGRFTHLASRINSLLAAERPIELVCVSAETEVALMPGVKRHYRIPVLGESLPLKLRFLVPEGVKDSVVYLSSVVSRPSHESCDKHTWLASPETFIAYCGRRETEKTFQEEFIHMSIETPQNLKLSFQCAFGKGKPLCITSSLV